MSNNKLLSFYIDLLDSAGFEFDDDFFVMNRQTDKKKPENVKILDRKLLLPLPSHLKNPNSDENIFFHPLCEQIIRNESEVFAYLKRAMTIRLMLSMSSVALALIRIHTDLSIQKTLSIDQIEFIKDLSDCDDQTITAWTNFIWGTVSANPHDSTKWPMRLYVKQNGRYQNKNYLRVCSVAFPLFDRIISGEEIPKPNSDKKFRAKDYRAFKQLALTIFPEIKDDLSEVYNSGCGDTFAPNLFSFLQSFLKLAKRINHIVDVMADSFERAGAKPESIKIPLLWEEFLDKDGIEALARENRKIPALSGNMGVAASDAKVKQESDEEKTGSQSTRQAASRSDTEAEDRRQRLAKRLEAESKIQVVADTPPWEDEKKPTESSSGKINFNDLLRKNPAMEKSTLTYEESEEQRRGSRRGWRDRDERDYDDRDSRYDNRRGYRDDRDYDRRDSRYESRRGYRDDRDSRYSDRDSRYDNRDSRYDDRNDRRYAPRRSLYGDPAPRRGYR